MTYVARILADSMSPAGARLTTFELTFPRLVLAEFNTHRAFSRNSASSRAIPVTTQLRRVLEHPYVPTEFGSNQPGMQAGTALAGEKARIARQEWLGARDAAVAHVVRLITNPSCCGVSASRESLAERVAELSELTRAKTMPEDWLNVHKQLANRLLEPFMWHTLIVTATEWENFLHLRAHRDTQPELRRVACMMRDAWEAGSPIALSVDEWHLPLTGLTGGHPEDERLATAELLKVAVGRCARVSYLTHGGVRDAAADIALHDRLLESGHLSPFEHPAQPIAPCELAESIWCGNFRGWRSYRKLIPGESDPLGPRTENKRGLPDRHLVSVHD